jgi:hypothetical protein
MIFSRPTRRLLVGIAAAFLLLCQSAMAAQACGVAPAIAGEPASSEHCHGADAQSGGAPDHALHQACPSHDASLSLAKLDVPQAADLPALALPPQLLRAAVRDALIITAVPARAESPPLAILHCCLRN